MKRRLFAFFTVLMMFLSMIPFSSFASGSCPPHNWGKWVVTVQATCYDKGCRYRKCLKCRETQDETYGPLSHYWKEIENVPGDCQTKGHITKQCTRCKYKYTTDLGYGDHQWGEWYEPEDTVGMRERDCQVCGLPEYEYFPVLRLKLEIATPPQNPPYYQNGEEVDLVATLTNDGMATAHNIKLTLSGPQWATLKDLPPNESDSHTFTHKIHVDPSFEHSYDSAVAHSESDETASVYSNVVYMPIGTPLPGENMVTVTKTAISKPDYGSAYQLGEPVCFMITVTNLTDETLYNLKIKDQTVGRKNGSTWVIPGGLSAHATHTFKLDVPVTQFDITQECMINTVTVEGAVGAPYATCTVPCGNAVPALSVEKKIINMPASCVFYPNDTIEYEITVTNTSAYPLSNITVRDHVSSQQEVELETIASLQPSESKTILYSYVVTKEDAEIYGFVANTVHAQADSMPYPVSRFVSVTCKKKPDVLWIHKYAVSDSENGKYYTEGEEVTFEIEVKNIGTEPVTNLVINDPTVSSDPIAMFAGPFEPSKSFTTQVKIKVTEQNVMDGFVANKANVTADQQETPVESAEASVPCWTNAYNIVLQKSISNPQNEPYQEKDVIEYLVTAVNSSTGPVRNVTVYDPLAGSKPIGTAAGPITPGNPIGSWTFKHKVTANDMGLGVVNTAYATIAESSEIYYSNTITAACGTAPLNGVSVTKKVLGSAPNGKNYYEQNDTVKYLITVTNTGTTPISSGVLYDSLKQTDGGKIGDFPKLDPKKSFTANFSYVLTDPPECGYLDNYARLTFSNADGDPDMIVSNTVRVDTDGIEDPDITPELTPSEGQSCGIVYGADGKPVLSYCPDHGAVHSWAEKLEDAASAREMWQEALDAEYEVYFEAANGPAKASLLGERMRFSSFLTARERALKALYPEDAAKADALIAELLEQKVVLMCYELHNAPAERTGFAREATGSAQAELMLRMTECYDAFASDAFRTDASFFTSWLSNRQEILGALYPEDASAVQKALEQEILDNILRLNGLR